MPTIYPYTYSSEGTGPWWGIQCSRTFYESMVRRLPQETTRCFVYITNERGDTLAMAVEGPHNEGDDIVFARSWVFDRLRIHDGATIMMEPILEQLPKGETVVIRPLTGVSVEGPMFLEGLTEAFNQLGVVQEGLVSAIVDPSMPELHEFMIENLAPAKVCLADGELRVELERALDRPPSPLTVPSITEPQATEPQATEPLDFNDTEPMFSEATHSPVAQKGYVAFGGTGHRLDKK